MRNQKGSQIMSYKRWLLVGSLAVAGAAQSVACSSKFNTCEAKRTCAPGGASGMAGAAGTRTGDGEAGAEEGGSAGLDTQAGAAGTADDDGSAAGTAGDSSIDAELEIATPTLAAGKTYVPFTGKLMPGSTSPSCRQTALLQRPRWSPRPPAPSCKTTSIGCPDRA